MHKQKGIFFSSRRLRRLLYAKSARAARGRFCLQPSPQMPKPYDPLVLTWRAAYMQRIADCVRLGYCRWISGEVPLERAPAFMQKFAALYRVDASRGQRLRLRRAGLGAARLLLYAPKSEGEQRAAKVIWVLLVSDGEHPAAGLEKLRDARAPGERIRVGGYELLQLPRKGSGKPAWTWRMPSEKYQGWRERVIQAARKPWLGAEADIIKGLYGIPGFAGARSQVGYLVSLWRREWKRRRAATEPFPKLPQLRYVQRLKNLGVPLSQLAREEDRPSGASQ